MNIGDFLRLLFKPSGPRREAADKIDAELATASRDNLNAVERNLHAIQRLIANTLDRLEGHRRDEHDRAPR